MTIFETLGVIAVILLTILIFSQIIQAHGAVYETVEIDPEDPAMKELIEQRESLINTILAHFSVVTGTDPETLDANCKMVNLSPAASVLTILLEDGIYRFVIHWDKYIKCIFFANHNECSFRKTSYLLIKENVINEKKYNDRLTKFYDKVYSDILQGIDDDEFMAIGIQAAKELMKQDDTAIKTFLFDFVSHFDANDYKDSKRALIQYTQIMAFILKFYKKEFEEYIKIHSK